MTTYWTTMDSPIDELMLVADDDGLTHVAFTPFVPPSGESADQHPVLAAARHQLGEFFAGERRDFDLPLAASGTQFRRLVWDQLRTIPYGTTTTYGAIARTLGLTGHGARAVGVANGANPIAVVVPCHRVVGSDGRLTGYAGGLDRKRALLALENSGLC
jgi:methylated-DNA-[protein]-cysteine S-methyltransferase